MNVFISNHQRARKINLQLLKRIAAEILTELKIENGELEVNLVGAKEITRLNEKFLRHEGSTDVITFDYQNSEGRMTNGKSEIHGELFICVDEAILQARKFKTDWRSEIVRYMIHGVLHLIGFDDLRAAAKQKMKRAENRLVRELSRRFALSKW